jgi:hypothetical protein
MKLRIAEAQVKVVQVIALKLFEEIHKTHPNIHEFLNNFERSFTESYEFVSLDGSPPDQELLTVVAGARQAEVECFKMIRRYLEEEGVEG